MKSFSTFLVILMLLYGKNGQQLHPKQTQTRVERVDTRTQELQDLLERRHSPMASSSAAFIQIADKYNLDWKILPAIAGVESGFETNGNIHDFNAWGYMCGSSPCVFGSYPEGIERVAKTISSSRAYKEYRETGQTLALAKPYNYADPEGWTAKIEYFRGKLK